MTVLSSARPEAPTEAQLLAAVHAGDQQALAKLYDRLSPVVAGLARRMLGDGPEADEVVLEVFTQVWRQAGRYDAGRGSASAWIMVIARSRALDALRVRQRDAARVAALEAEPMGAPHWADPADEALVQERRDEVAKALSGLPETQRLALELAYYEGLTQVEIAEKTGSPLGTVKTRIRSGLLRLRDLMVGVEVRP